MNEPHAHQERKEVTLSEGTKIKITPPQMMAIIGLTISSVAFYFAGLQRQNAQFQDVKVQLTEIQYEMRGTVKQSDFRNWVDNLRAANPHNNIPPFHERTTSNE